MLANSDTHLNPFESRAMETWYGREREGGTNRHDTSKHTLGKMFADAKTNKAH